MNHGNKTKNELKKFFTAVEQTADGIFITNPKGVIEYVNPSFEKMTGFTKKEALGKTPSIIKSGQQDDKIYKKLWSTILSGKTFRSVVINKKKNGELFYTDHTITPLKDDKGKITHFVGIWKDITEKIQEEKRKDEFISLISHELKTPVTSIKGFLQILQSHSNNLENPMFGNLLTKTQQQISNLIVLIEDLLNAIKTQKGKLKMKKTFLLFDEQIKDIVENIRPLATKHNILFKGATEKYVYADSYRLNQVISNLLFNAIKYSLNGEIIVSVYTKKNNVICSVQDFGLGISSENQEKIFDQFFRVDDKKQKTYPGMGLGLYIAKEIIKMHKGKIWVESKKDKGSTFFISLHIVNPKQS